MRKKAVALAMAALMAGTIFAGCGKQEVTDTDPADYNVISTVEPEISVEEPEEPEEPVETNEGEVRSTLTGEWVSAEVENMRPVAVMIGNTVDALPQYGTSEASVYYEATVEGGLTRIMAIFENYPEVEKIMSIRSCRLYYIDWALEFDALYVHFGQSYLAEDMLSQDYVDNLSGLDGSLDPAMFHRDSSRKSPHNAYTTGEDIVKGISIKGYETQHSDSYAGHYQFNTDDNTQITLDDGQDAAVVVPGYPVNNPWFEYDSDTGLYRRYEYNAGQVDGNNDEILTVKNILIQETPSSVADANCGYLDMDTLSGGSGYYITNGKAIPIVWSKDSQTAPTKYYKLSGEEITLNQGKTWVCVTQTDRVDSIHIYATRDEFSGE